MADPSGRLRFGPFELDARSGELWRDSLRVPLQRQPGRVLQILAQSPGQVVSREALRREIWGDASHVNFAHGLNFCVRQVRLALGDSAEHPIYIETLPRAGYRFLAPVEGQSSAVGSSAEVSLPRPSAATRSAAAKILRYLHRSLATAIAAFD
jgi:DNA-binding winged helix-turn-helix (wHTH) protein